MSTNPGQEENLALQARIFLGEPMIALIDHNLFSEVLTALCSVIQHRIWPEINNKMSVHDLPNILLL
jgi:hypothetical protein